jgi:hypothetical protein
MQSRSWMAALALAVAMVGANAPRSIAGGPAPIKQKVQLILRLDGLSSKGGEIEIKPGNAGCKFETIKFQTKNHPRTTSDGKIIKLDPFDIETMSADGNCSFSITLKEAGQPDKTVRRNLKITMTPAGETVKPQAMTCYISSNSLNPVASKPAGDSKSKK